MIKLIAEEAVEKTVCKRERQNSGC